MAQLPLHARWRRWGRLALGLAGLALASPGCVREDAVDYAILDVEADPEFDFETSPHTGWTREHYVALFGRTVHGWSQNLSPGGVRSRFPGDPNAPEQLEGVTRMLPVFGAWLSNPENPRVIRYRGVEHDILGYARRLILDGTDPEDPEYWGPFEGPAGQRNVEAVFVAEFLHSTRHLFWDELLLPEQQQIMDWLEAGTDFDYVNNWKIIVATRDAVRAELGYSIDPDAHQERLDDFENHYLGDGWFRDSQYGHEIDGYNGFIIHSEWLWWAQIEGDGDPERRERVEARARTWLSHLPFMLAADGASVPIGRSLVYRTAWLAPLALALRFDLSPLEPGLARRILSAQLSWHIGDSVAASGRMFDDRDTMQWGWIDDDPNALEAYQNPGGQYLAARVLEVLALPSDHPFWTETEGTLPADAGSFVHAIASAGFHLSYAGGVLVLENLLGYKSERSFHPRFAKLAYASHLPFSVRAAEGARPVDAAILPSEDGMLFESRGPTLAAGMTEGFAWTQHETAVQMVLGIGQGGFNDDIRTGVVLTPAGRVRLTCITPSNQRPVWWYEGGFAQSAQLEDSSTDLGAGWSYARSDGVSQLVAALDGYEAPSALEPWLGEGQHNLVHESEGVMFMQSAQMASVAASTCGASLVRVDREAFDPEAGVADLASWEQSADTLRLEWTGGAVWMNLQRVPAPADLELAERQFSGPLRYARAEDSWWAADGVSEVRDGQGQLYESLGDTAGSVSCRAVGEGTVECELGGPARLRTPDAADADDWRIEVIGVGELSAWVGTSEGPRVVVDESAWGQLIDPEGPSRLRLRFSART